MHKTDQPNFISDLLDSHILTGKGSTEIDLLEEKLAFEDSQTKAVRKKLADRREILAEEATLKCCCKLFLYQLPLLVSLRAQP